jgi:NAD(P)-dependent dehydrogenase (short-subunit alcohol dehydrogenase family)
MGQACARRLATDHLVVLANRDVRKSEAVAREFANDGLHSVAIACDVTDPESVAEMVRRSAELGPIVVAALVAGLSPSMADARRIMDVNLVGTATVVDTVLPVIAPGGVVVLVSSIAGHNAAPSSDVTALLDDPLGDSFLDDLEAALGREMTAMEAYQFSKLGEIRMPRRLVARFANRGARIVSLSPGIIETPMGALEFRENPQKRALFQRSPLARVGTLDEICDAMEFVCSERAAFITGTDLLVDGGLTSAVEFDLPEPFGDPTVALSTKAL